jgi:hypothetical protein
MQRSEGCLFLKTDAGIRKAHRHASDERTGMHQISKSNRRKSKSKQDQEYEHGLPAVLGCKG